MLHAERWRPFAAVFLLLLLTGCAAPLPRVTGPSAPIDLATLPEWGARGRIAVAAKGEGGSGSFNWEQSGERTVVQIQGPVGIGGMRLTVEGDRVLLENNGRALESDAAWAELEARLGAPVPARNLRYWLLGIPAPGEHQWLAATPPAAMLAQDGWQIAYDRYGDEKSARLPGRVTATSGDSRVRLVIDRWRLGPL